jgi:cytochrome c5
MLFSACCALADATPPGTADEIRERLRPAGNVCVAGKGCGTATVVPTGTGLTGEQIYGQFCTACHSTGVSGAPKVGDPTQWAPRIAKGMDVLMGSIVNGLAPLMPPRGTCVACTDAELQSVLQHMVDASK